MKKYIFAFVLLITASLGAHAQGEQRIWAFGVKGGLDFTTLSPLPAFTTTNLFPGDYSSASVCAATGQLLFYTNGFWVWNRYHEIMPELTGGVPGYTTVISPTIGYPPLMPWDGTYATQATAIAAAPAHPGIYYVFSLSATGTLYYSMIDMSMNAGKGGIMPGKKGVYMASGLAEKLTVVKGCNNIWIMTRSKAANQYRAFELNDTGLVTTPAVSNVGHLPVSWYNLGVIKFSPDGTRMAAACNTGLSHKGGLELYDFNGQTGTLTNPLVLDSSSTLGNYFGACFSPDNSKLYATTSSFSYSGNFYSGKVKQFDVSLSTPAAIAGSNTMVYSDFVYALNRVGDLKRGEDGKIYFSSAEPANSTLHCISSPNTAGLACNALSNVIAMPVGTASRGMPNDIAFIQPPDSVRQFKAVTVCFRDSTVISADSGKQYLWDNGSSSRTRKVGASGTYVVRYINMDCKYKTDSIFVRFVKLPSVSGDGYSCPGKGQAAVWVKPQPSDTTIFQYQWRDGANNIIRLHTGSHGDTLRHADTGTYYVQITTPSGCDTTLSVKVLALPVPVAAFEADSIACKGVPLSFTNTGTAPLWQWYFGDGNFSNQQNPAYSYGRTGNFTVSLVATNIEGCPDTAYKEISIKSLELELRSDKTLGDKGELIQLQTSGSENYTVTSWQPALMFPDQTAKWQTAALDTTRLFIVTAVSDYGCIGKSSVEVAVNPVVFMPNCFTPNGDGTNDRFRPVGTGYIFVRYFEIYNRYGQQVYKGVGKNALDGWDGTFNGQPCELGTYYYHINIETKENNTIKLKGDVILLR